MWVIVVCYQVLYSLSQFVAKLGKPKYLSIEEIEIHHIM